MSRTGVSVVKGERKIGSPITEEGLVRILDVDIGILYLFSIGGRG